MALLADSILLGQGVLVFTLLALGPTQQHPRAKPPASEASLAENWEELIVQKRIFRGCNPDFDPGDNQEDGTGTGEA